MSRKVIFCILCAALCAALAVIPASAVTTQCETYPGDNIGDQDYAAYGVPIKSYLVPTSDGGVMRVQAGREIEGVLVEYYDASHNIIRSKTKHIAEELPEFGAFYASGDAYYILTGQYNLTESPTVEVFRVTKYDKNWKRIDSAGLSDCNTTVPFDAGNARMEAYGNYLIVRTSHEMYKLNDGLNHQSNITFEIDTRTMEVTDALYGIVNENVGYVSHSFNQFVHIENGRIVAVDHGDGYPRSIALIKYPSEMTAGEFVDWGCEVTDVLEFYGDIGVNYTGASVGAFEISDSSYLIAGNTVVQDEKLFERSTRNVFVASVDKASGAVSVNMITDYKEGSASASTPHMVKLGGSRWLVLWERDGKVFYTEVDGKGKRSASSKIYSLDGRLSDCVPVVSGGKLTWYTWNEGTITFYDINVSDISRTYVTEINNGHHFEFRSANNGIATVRCTVCGEEKQFATARSIFIYYEDENGQYWSSKPDDLRKGDVLNIWVTGSAIPEGVEPNDEWTVKISDESVVSFTPTLEQADDLMGSLKMLSPGRAEVTVSPKYNPDVKRTIYITVKCDVHGGADGKKFTIENAREATCTSPGYTGDKVCAVCGEIVERGSTIPMTDHKTERKNAKTATCTSQGYTGDLVCTVCGKTVEAGKAIPKTAHEFVNGVCVVCGAKKTSGEPPVTEPPSTTPSVTEPGVTDSPATEPTGTGTPLTEPPATGETEQPDTGSDTSEPMTTEPVITDSTVTEPEVTEPSDVGTGSSDSTAVTTSAKTERVTDDDGADRDSDISTSDEKTDGEDGGCGSVMSVSAVMCTLCAAVVCAAFKRREHGNEK